MSEQLVINVPEWFELNGFSPIDTIFSSTVDDVGILLVGENFSEATYRQPIVRLYLLNKEHGVFEVKKELDSYKFNTLEEAVDFSEHLPNLNALDFILLLNKQQKAFS